MLIFVANSYGQTGLKASGIEKNRSESTKRCATMDRVEMILNSDASAKAIAQRGGGISPAMGNTPSSYRTNAIVTIPVVVHIVLPNPGTVTDADVNSQIKELNDDFSGLNADSTNIPAAFQAVRGHSQIRFTLARRTPAGLLTNGIERRASATGSNINLAVDPIKRTASGGLDAWDAGSYLNIWCGNDASGQGILGYAQFPGTGSVADDGVFLNYQSFGIGACSNIPIYNKGRTGGHEVGHYFGLFHIWGDDGGCAADDFRPMSSVGSTCVLPASLANPPGQGNTAADIGDTPNQAGATTNCPTGVATDACSPAAPGKMYQNYMDYTADACYSLFTNKQAARMEYVLDNCRASLKTSLGATPPAGAITRDAAPSASVNPGGFEQVGCAITTFPATLSCPGAIVPKVRIVNNGLNTLSTVTVGVIINGGSPTTVNISPNLVFGATTVVSFPSINVVVGTYTFKYFTSNANGLGADQAPANDTLTRTLTVTAASPLPAQQNFTTGPFPQTPWTVFNPNADFTWIWVVPGNPGPSITIDNYNNNAPGRIDEFRSTALSVGATDSVVISFDLAHKNYPGSFDALGVYVSTNCGQTFTLTSYNKSGAALATAGSSTGAYTAPAAADWRRERVAIGGSFLSSGQIIVAFRNTNDYGNYIFIDNINIDPRVARNLKTDNILTPGANECSPTFVPRAIVKNDGTEAVTAFKVGYTLNGAANVITAFTQTIPVGGSVTVSLPAATGVVGANIIRVFSADPVTISGTGDNVPNNDTLTKAFTVKTLINMPVVEGFEGTFPPPGWTIRNPNNQITWVKKAPGRNSGFSAFINNWGGVTNDQDDIEVPALRVTGDSVLFSFDLAHKYYAPSPDTLLLLVSTDCGNTFTPVYKKWGANLATAGTGNSDYTNPAAADWRRERVAIGGAFVSSGSVVFRLRNHSRFGNNIWVDNINIEEVFKRDIALTSINAPLDVLCTATATTPAVTVTNRGIDVITGFKVTHVLDNGTPSTTTVTGVSLANGQSMSVSLNPITPAVGTHNLLVYTSDPVSITGTGDSRRSNDTLRKTFFVSAIVPVPLAESFEGITFPPAGWALVNPDNNITWSRTTTAARSGVASAYINNFNYVLKNTIDRLVSPVMTQPVATDSIFLNFDFAHSPGFNYPGSTNLPLDTLEVSITKDCGVTFTSLFKKWGEDLQTLGDPLGPNNPNPIEFIPGQPNHWRNVRLHLNPTVGTGNFQVYFNARSNGQNNLYLDNVNITTRTLPARLKAQGYLVYPNPFHNAFTVHHFAPPTLLKGISVHNAAGQKVYEKQFNRDATTEMTVDLSNLAAGVYLVKLHYLNKLITERIVKQ